jgi:dipeptidyl-peptidase-3
MFKVLSAVGGSFLTITDGKASDTITVKVDRDKNASHGKPAIADSMIKLHIWRCTADVKHYREYHVPLTEPTGVYLKWRRVMLTKQTPRQVFVQPNTFIRDGEVFLKEYQPTVDGMIQSWAERMRMLQEEMEK